MIITVDRQEFWTKFLLITVILACLTGGLYFTHFLEVIFHWVLDLLGRGITGVVLYLWFLWNLDFRHTGFDTGQSWKESNYILFGLLENLHLNCVKLWRTFIFATLKSFLLFMPCFIFFSHLFLITDIIFTLNGLLSFRQLFQVFRIVTIAFHLPKAFPIFEIYLIIWRVLIILIKLIVRTFLLLDHFYFIALLGDIRGRCFEFLES